MKIILLTQYYPPEIGAPQTRLSLLVRRLVERGHSVTVLTAMPNYPQGRIMIGYGGLLKFEELSGAKIIRTFIYPSQKASYLQRMANYFSFVFSSALTGTIFLKKSHYIMVESPPLFLGLSAYWLSRIKRARLIFNVADPWPDKLVDMGLLDRQNPLYLVSSRLANFFYRQAWVVSYQEPGILFHIKERAQTAKTFFLSNGADTKLFGPANYNDRVRRELAGDAQYLAVFAGMHNLQQGLFHLLDVAEKLKEHGLNIRFALVGEGPEKSELIRLAAKKNLNIVKFFEGKPANQIPAVLASADIALAPFKLALKQVVPVKMYEALATGRPVVLMAALDGEAARIVRQYNCGLVVAPGDIEGMAAAIVRLCQDEQLRQELGQNGRQAAVQHYDRTMITDRFIDYLEANLPG